MAARLRDRFQEGDVILEINRKKIESCEISKAMGCQPEKGILFHIHRKEAAL
jgi:hypothetical protein